MIVWRTYGSNPLGHGSVRFLSQVLARRLGRHLVVGPDPRCSPHDGRGAGPHDRRTNAMW